MDRLVEYGFLAHVFGSSASPTVTSYVLRHHAERIKGQFGNEVHEIMRKFYVDDGAGGVNDKRLYRKLKEDLTEAMKRGGFTLSKWKFSHPELMGEEPHGEGKTEKILGVVWNMKKDTFSPAFDEEKFKERARTPRGIVQRQAAIHDPLGISAPFQLLGRKLTQKAMQGKWGWDTPLDKDLEEEFWRWSKSVVDLKSLTIPRAWDNEATVGGLEEFHFFVDASFIGYGTVGYRVATAATGEKRVVFVGGRSHVVPLDPSSTSHHNSMPRLELVAAVKGVELMKTTEKSIGTKIENLFMWTDSSAVMKQINDRTTPHAAFVSNRLSKVHKNTSKEQWRFIDSELNPADMCSRGIRAHEKDKWKRYLEGPQFLQLPRNEWPKMKIPAMEEVTVACMITQRELPKSFVGEIAARREGWEEKIILIWNVKRAIKRWKILTQKRSSRSRSIELQEADQFWPNAKGIEMELVRAIQEGSFWKEIEELKKKGVSAPNSRKEMSKKMSPLAPHNPFWTKRAS